jgi:hypothetical protein
MPDLEMIAVLDGLRKKFQQEFDVVDGELWSRRYQRDCPELERLRQKRKQLFTELELLAGEIDACY